MTEKDYNPEQRTAKAMKKQNKMKKTETAPVKKAEAKQEKEVNKIDVKKPTEKDEKKSEEKKAVGKKKSEKIIRKDEAVVSGRSLSVSTKDAVGICRFIRKKSIGKAFEDLEEVLKFKKAIPMKGEIPHRKGKIMSGRYPINAVKEFVRMLKNLSANSNVNGLEEPVIAEAVPNKASRPYGRFGAVKRKRTHVRIVARDKSKIKKKIGRKK